MPDPVTLARPGPRPLTHRWRPPAWSRACRACWTCCRGSAPRSASPASATRGSRRKIRRGARTGWPAPPRSTRGSLRQKRRRPGRPRRPRRGWRRSRRRLRWRRRSGRAPVRPRGGPAGALAQMWSWIGPTRTGLGPWAARCTGPATRGPEAQSPIPCVEARGGSDIAPHVYRTHPTGWVNPTNPPNPTQHPARTGSRDPWPGERRRPGGAHRRPRERPCPGHRRWPHPLPPSRP